MSRLSFAAALSAGALLFHTALAHEHHSDRIPEGAGVSSDPIDTILWAHILIQILAWGILFPLGMVFGIIRHRLHVPTQVVATSLAVVGYFLGHKHKGRQFAPNVHSKFAPWLNWALFAQVVLGVYLRLHIERGFMGKIRNVLVVLHGVLGKAMPVAAWAQMLFGGITALGFCRGDHVGQCAAHFIMGSAFIAYGIIMVILLLVGQMWLRRMNKSQEFFDSLIITIWGCINTFTEHHWGTAWVRNDLQHTTMGIIWWCAGLVGIWLSRTRDGRPKRNVVPALVIFLTGYGMSAHPQELMLSTMVHSFFGYTLMMAGVTRIIEVCFVLNDKQTLSLDGSNPHSFQFLTPFLLFASGFLFMGATEEQMVLLSSAHVTHVSYILLLFSISFLLFLFTNVLLHIYAVYAFPPPGSSDAEPAHQRYDSLAPESSSGSTAVDGDVEAQEAGRAGLNGHAASGMTDAERRRVKDAEEFELDALISDDESEGGGRHGRAKPRHDNVRLA